MQEKLFKETTMDTALLKNCILKILQHFQIRQQEFKE
jgi:hypothetical protein